MPSWKILFFFQLAKSFADEQFNESNISSSYPLTRRKRDIANIG